MHVEHLAATAEFPQNSLPDEPVVLARDVGAHGQAIDGRGLDETEIPHPPHGHLQRPGYGCGRERKHIDLFAQALEFFLGAHAEAVLFVHHQHAQPGKVNVFLKQAMGAHHHVHGAGGQLAKHERVLGLGAQPRHHAYA